MRGDSRKNNSKRATKKLLSKSRSMKKSTSLKKGTASSQKNKDSSNQQDQNWYKHWEKEKEEIIKKDQGGKSRPKRPDYKKK